MDSALSASDRRGRRQELHALRQRRHCGHLFDIEAVKGAPKAADQEVTVAESRAAMQTQNMQEVDVKEGDAPSKRRLPAARFEVRQLDDRPLRICRQCASRAISSRVAA